MQGSLIIRNKTYFLLQKKKPEGNFCLFFDIGEQYSFINFYFLHSSVKM